MKKNCSKGCGEFDLSEFNVDRRSKRDGLRSNCWICDKAYQANRRATILKLPGVLNGLELRHLLEENPNCPYGWCNGSTLGRDAVIDHVVPLDAGGGNSIDNIIWACSMCNEHKRAKPFDIAMKESWSRHPNKLQFCPNPQHMALLPVSEFRVTGANVRGREGWCKACNRRRKRTKYHKTKVDLLALSEKYDRY